MNSRMISDDPSKIKLMRKSRIARSIGIGRSPRRASDSPSRSPAPADLQRVVHDPPPGLAVYSFAIAASSRMSYPPR